MDVLLLIFLVFWYKFHSSLCLRAHERSNKNSLLVQADKVTDKPLTEPMMTQTHMCVWWGLNIYVNSLWLGTGGKPLSNPMMVSLLTHASLSLNGMTYWCLKMCISVKWVIFGSDIGLSHFQCQAITRTNADLFSVGLLWIDVNEISIKTQIFSI